MKIAVVEDLFEEQQKLTNYLNRYLNEHYIPLTSPIKHYESGEAFLEHFSANQFDLIFLDIYMAELTGIDTAKIIRQSDEDVKLIFLTTSNDFASESYEVDSSYYIVKPYEYERLKTALDRVVLSAINDQRFIELPEGTKILLRDIVYTEYQNRYIHIHLKNGTELTVRMNQQDFEPYLSPYPNFHACHRGIIVNFDAVKVLDELGFKMITDITVPVSRPKQAKIKSLYSKYCFAKLRGTNA